MQLLLQNLQLYFSVIKDLVTIISLIIASIVGIKGLQTWRRQLRGTADYELAKRLLKTIYNLREAIHQARQPAWKIPEYVAAIKEVGRKKDAFNPEIVKFILGLRHKTIREMNQELDIEKIEVEAQWGITEKSKISEFQSVISLLDDATSYYFIYLTNPKDKQFKQNEITRLEKIVFEQIPVKEEDKYLKDLNFQISLIEQMVRSYLVK